MSTRRQKRKWSEAHLLAFDRSDERVERGGNHAAPPGRVNGTHGEAVLFGLGLSNKFGPRAGTLLRRLIPSACAAARISRRRALPARSGGTHFLLRFPCENAIVLVIAATLATVTVTLGYALLVVGSRYAF